MKCKLRYKMRIIFLFSFTIIFAQSQNFDLVENRSEIALQHFMEGEFLLNQGNYAMAILEFQEAVEADPDGATIHVSIADAFRRLGKIRRAEKHLHIAIEIEPLDKEAYEMLGLLYLLEKKYDLAEKQFKALVELDPDFSDYYFSLGDIYRLKNEKVKAIEYYLKTYEANSLATNALEKSLQIAININQFIQAEDICRLLLDEFPDDVKYWETYRDIALFNQHFSKAIDAVDGLIEIHGLNVELLIHKSAIYRASHEEDTALKILQQAFALDSLNQDIYQEFVSLYMDMENYEEALKYNNKFIELFPQDPRGFLNSAIVSMAIKEPIKATEILIEHIGLLEGNFTAYSILGSAYNQLHEYENAEQFLLKAMALHSNAKNIQHSLAMVWDSLHKWEKSDSLYQVLIDSDSTDAQALNNYAYSLSERNEQLEQALSYAKKAVQLTPNSAPYLDTLGWIYYKMGSHTEAISYVEKSIKIDGKNAIVIEHLGDILMENNQIYKAQKIYKQALKLDEKNQTLKDKISQ